MGSESPGIPGAARWGGEPAGSSLTADQRPATSQIRLPGAPVVATAAVGLVHTGSRSVPGRGGSQRGIVSSGSSLRATSPED